MPAPIPFELPVEAKVYGENMPESKRLVTHPLRDRWIQVNGTVCVSRLWLGGRMMEISVPYVKFSL
jgi:hypothetical protein